MGRPPHATNERTREWRRRVLLPAQLHIGHGLTDVSIHNISSHGMLVHARQPSVPGTIVELYLGDCAISARVVWRDGLCMGLHTDVRVPLEQILSLSHAPAQRLTAVECGAPLRQAAACAHDHHRNIGRMIEFAWIGLIALLLSALAVATVVQGFARPLARVGAVLAPR